MTWRAPRDDANRTAQQVFRGGLFVMVFYPTMSGQKNYFYKKQGAPLADRMRPADLSEVVGQNHIASPGRPLFNLVQEGNLPSLLLWGPPGCGKTSLAHLLAQKANRPLETLSAAMAGVREVREVISRAETLKEQDEQLVLFLDEIHRFNKTQQDSLLHHVESGTLTLIAATTENPSFQVVSPLLSRLLVFRLETLSPDDLVMLVQRALKDSERGLGELNVKLDDSGLGLLVEAANGDARKALNLLETAALSARPDQSGQRTISREDVVAIIKNPLLYHDASGDNHYDVISALIKSMRGSDPDAALYWLARMVEAGDDPLFIARRMVIFAAEDVGNADPEALRLALSVKDAVHFVGMPEGWIPLAQGAVYLATAPKSNASYTAYGRAKGDVVRLGNLPVPMHLRNAPTDLMKKIGCAEGYMYPHDYPDRIVDQTYLPDVLKGKTYYKPGTFGFEKEIAKRLEWWKKKRRELKIKRDSQGER